MFIPKKRNGSILEKNKERISQKASLKKPSIKSRFNSMTLDQH